MAATERGLYGEYVYSVSEISTRIREVLELEFAKVGVEGEVTRFTVAQSGHAYFSLSEQTEQGTATLDCVIYRFARSGIAPLRNGQRVIATGRITSWAGSSKYQLNVWAVWEKGLGDLLRRLEELKRRLAEEGLFDQARKRRLPFWPRRIGVVTSLQGAAVRDIVRTVLSRFPAKILIAPSLVQGEGAAENIAAQIAALNLVPDVDVVIVGRGGGSFEDLWPFNEEVVVRAIAASRVPVISAVGHEIDHVLADEAADLRAATPTAAGQIVVPDIRELWVQLESTKARLYNAAARVVNQALQRLDESRDKLEWVATRLLAEPKHKLALLEARLFARHPARMLEAERKSLDHTSQRLLAIGRRLLQPARHSVETLAARLVPLSPLAPLQRGYALVRNSKGRLISRYDQAQVGDAVEVWLGLGAMECEVTSTRPERQPLTEQGTI